MAKFIIIFNSEHSQIGRCREEIIGVGKGVEERKRDEEVEEKENGRGRWKASN